jgi:predicted transcriptional regulator
MTIREIASILNGTILCGEEFMDRDVKTGCGCDLMSHVLAHIQHDHTLLLTGLTTPQVVYACDAVDIKAVCFVRGKQPDDETITLAKEREMVLLCTTLPLFESCGKLYQKDLLGCSEYEQ